MGSECKTYGTPEQVRYILDKQKKNLILQYMAVVAATSSLHTES